MMKAQSTPAIRVLDPYGARLRDLKQPSVARRLLELKQASIVSRHPFTIQLAVSRTYFESTRDFVLWRDGYHCHACGSRKHLTVHHITPRSQGGANRAENLTTLCRACHRQHHQVAPLAHVPMRGEAHALYEMKTQYLA